MRKNLSCTKKFHHEVTRMKWVDSEGLWHVTTSKGLYYGKIIVGAFGALSDPLIPKIKGMEKFQGEHFHSARWPKDFNPKGEKSCRNWYRCISYSVHSRNSTRSIFINDLSKNSTMGHSTNG